MLSELASTMRHVMQPREERGVKRAKGSEEAVEEQRGESVFVEADSVGG